MNVVLCLCHLASCSAPFLSRQHALVTCFLPVNFGQTAGLSLSLSHFSLETWFSDVAPASLSSGCDTCRGSAHGAHFQLIWSKVAALPPASASPLCRAGVLVKPSTRSKAKGDQPSARIRQYTSPTSRSERRRKKNRRPRVPCEEVLHPC